MRSRARRYRPIVADLFYAFALGALFAVLLCGCSTPSPRVAPKPGEGGDPNVYRPRAPIVYPQPYFRADR